MKIHLTRTIFAPSLTKSLAAGQTDAVVALGPGELNDRSARRFHKILNADEYLTWDGENTIISNGCTVPGFAFWAGVQATQLAGFTHRHRILALVRPDGCCAYAIPVPKLEGTFNLPDIELTAGELDSYLRIANSITPAPAEYTVQCPHPARTAVKSNRTEWRSNELNPEALGQLLQQHANWLFPVITAALDVQLRSFAPCAEVPIFLYNFTAKKPNLQADQAITRAFTALNLTTEGAACNSAPPQITVLDSGDLADWSGCRDRLVLLRTSTGAPLKPLFDALDECERQTRFGGVLPRRLSTVPIVRSRTIFDRSDTVDIELPSTIDSLTNYDLDLLRIAAARTLTKANAAEAYRRWYGPMTSLARYQLDPFEVWRDAVMRISWKPISPRTAWLTLPPMTVSKPPRKPSCAPKRNARKPCGRHSSCSVSRAVLRLRSSRNQTPPTRPLGCLMTSRQLLRSGIHQHKEMIVVSRLLSSRTLLCFACCGVQG